MKKKKEKLFLETRGWDENKKKTFVLRSKETKIDYRFMRDADLPKLVIDSQFVKNVRNSMGEMPEEKITRYCKEYGLRDFDAESLIFNKNLVLFFDKVMKNVGEKSVGQTAFHWIADELTGFLKSNELDKSLVNETQIASIIESLNKGEISGKIGKKVLAEMWEKNDGKLCQEIVKEKNWGLITDEKMISEMCRKVVKENEKETKKYRESNENKKNRLLKFFMGNVMKKAKGKIDPERTKEIMVRELEE